MRERLRGCELVRKWYDIFFLSIVKCKHIRWGSDISYNTSNACPCSHNVSVETNLSSQARDRESLSFFCFLFCMYQYMNLIIKAVFNIYFPLKFEKEIGKGFFFFTFLRGGFITCSKFNFFLKISFNLNN